MKAPKAMKKGVRVQPQPVSAPKRKSGAESKALVIAGSALLAWFSLKELGNTPVGAGMNVRAQYASRGVTSSVPSRFSNPSLSIYESFLCSGYSTSTKCLVGRPYHPVVDAAEEKDGMSWQEIRQRSGQPTLKPNRYYKSSEDLGSNFSRIIAKIKNLF